MLRNPGFRRLWAVGALNSTMRWLEMVVLGLLAFQLTHSAFLVSLAFVFRMMPMLVFGIFIGMLADRVSRKVLLVGGLSVQAAVFGTIGALVALHVIQYWELVLGTFTSGIVWASEFPVRRAMIGEVVSLHNLGRAMGTDAATGNFTRILGPFVGGGLFQALGAQSAYFLGVGLLGSAALVALTLRYTRPVEAKGPRKPVFGELAQGFRYIRQSRLLVGALVITILANVFAFPHQSMIPVIGEDTLHVGATAIGLLSSVQGLGGLIGSVAIAAFAGPRHYTRIYFYGTSFFMATIALFAWSHWYAMSLAMMFISGFGMSSFGTMQSTIMVSASSPEMRGRVMGALAVSIGAQPVGQLYLGTTAGWLGAQMATMFLAIEGLFAMAAAAFIWPVLRRADSMDEAPSSQPAPSESTRAYSHSRG